MAVQPDTTTGLLTTTAGSINFTTSGTNLITREHLPGDRFLVRGLELQIATITDENVGTLTEVCPPEAAVSGYPVRLRFQPDGARVAAQTRNLIDLIGNGTLQSLAELNGNADELIAFQGPFTLTTVSRSSLIEGAAYDAQVNTLADRAAYDNRPTNYSVLVSDIGDGRAAIYVKRSDTDGDWSNPAYVTGPIGPIVSIEAGNTTTLPAGQSATVSVTPVSGGYAINIGVPQGFQGIPGVDGEQGPQGNGLQVDAVGPLSDRASYNSQPAGFTFFDTDNGDLYFRVGTAGNWSDPIPFQGPPGTSGAVITTTNGVGNGTIGPYPLNAAPINSESVWVSISGVQQYDYTISGTNITFGVQVPTGVPWQVKTSGPLPVGVIPDGSIESDQITNDPAEQELIRVKLNLNSLGRIIAVTSKPNLKSLNPANYDSAVLNGYAFEKRNYSDLNSLQKSDADGREGLFVRSTSDNTKVWARPTPGPVWAQWFGLSASETPINNSLAMQAAIRHSSKVLVPEIIAELSVDSGYGIPVVDNLSIEGMGYKKSIFYMRGGGSVSELRNYQSGSALRRNFDIGASAGGNARVEKVDVRKLGFVMNHPSNSISSTQIQIAGDFRNWTRSTIEDNWFGNFDPRQEVDSKGITRPFLVQGYAAVFGTEGGNPYSGGEVNVFRKNFLAGFYRGVSIDDNLISPSSAGYSIRVEDNDIQIGQILIYIASQYSAACSIYNNVLQATQKPNGNSNETFGMYINGYGHRIDGLYDEYGSDVQHILTFASQSRANLAKLGGVISATGGIVSNAIQDLGLNNVIEYFSNIASGSAWSSALPAATGGSGVFLRYINGAPDEQRISFGISSGNITIYQSTPGITVARHPSAVPGDFVISLARAFKNTNYTVSASGQIDNSRNVMQTVVSGKNNNSFRLEAYSQNITTGVSTSTDPVFVDIVMKQI